jgi:hypothetical protein
MYERTKMMTWLDLGVVEKVVKLAILLALIQLDVELLKTVQRQLPLVIDVNLQRILHSRKIDCKSLRVTSCSPWPALKGVQLEHRSIG